MTSIYFCPSAAKPDPFFRVQPNFRVQTCRIGPQDPIGSTSKRVQIPVQPYNVLNKPDLNLTHFWVGLGPQGPKLGSVVSGWPSGSEFGSNSGRVGFIWPYYTNLSPPRFLTFQPPCYPEVNETDEEIVATGTFARGRLVLFS